MNRGAGKLPRPCRFSQVGSAAIVCRGEPASVPVSALPLSPFRGPIAQRSEQPAHNRTVPGSNPGGPTIDRGDTDIILYPYGAAVLEGPDPGGAFCAPLFYVL